MAFKYYFVVVEYYHRNGYYPCIITHGNTTFPQLLLAPAYLLLIFVENKNRTFAITSVFEAQKACCPQYCEYNVQN